MSDGAIYACTPTNSIVATTVTEAPISALSKEGHLVKAAVGNGTLYGLMDDGVVYKLGE